MTSEGGRLEIAHCVGRLRHGEEIRLPSRVSRYVPCVQFPLPTGNIRQQKFIDIWRDSPALREVRSIRARDLPVCSTCSHVGTCTRCPGLAYMEGNMRGPSTADCEKSFQRTGIPSANMLLKARTNSNPLTQIQPAAVYRDLESPQSLIFP